jgi:hypothetical protein
MRWFSNANAERTKEEEISELKSVEGIEKYMEKEGNAMNEEQLVMVLE